MTYKKIIRPLLFKIEPEQVHHLLVNGLKCYRHLSPIRSGIRKKYHTYKPFSYKNIVFPNRIGLAAGFDKDAAVFDELADFGFGFIEIGTVTPHPLEGNAKPRIFRLIDDESLISRTGFNNPGLDVVLERIKAIPKRSYILGANINKDATSTTSEQIVADFSLLFESFYPFVDYFTLNWGSIDAADFEAVLDKLANLKKTKTENRCLFIKLPADIPEAALDTVIALAQRYHVDGFIATGPTMDRSNLSTAAKTEADNIGAGGVSGKGIGAKSVNVVRYLKAKTLGEFLIIGAGGIMTTQDAKSMLQAGADLLQVYSTFIYNGPNAILDLNKSI